MNSGSHNPGSGLPHTPDSSRTKKFEFAKVGPFDQLDFLLILVPLLALMTLKRYHLLPSESHLFLAPVYCLILFGCFEVRRRIRRIAKDSGERQNPPEEKGT